MSFYKETIGFIIHQRDFSDTSMILEFFSKDDGMIHILAKGIKKNKKLRAQIQNFSLLKIHYFGKSQLKKLSQINILQNFYPQDLINKTVGLYLNELLHYSLAEGDKAEVLFDCYMNTLKNLGKGKITPLLRHFEYVLLKHNGFELNVDEMKDEEAWLTFDEQKGLTTTQNDSQKLCLVMDVKLFLNHQILTKQSQKRLNKLMICMVNMSLSNRPIYARDMLKSLLSKS